MDGSRVHKIQQPCVQSFEKDAPLGASSATDDGLRICRPSLICNGARAAAAYWEQSGLTKCRWRRVP